jgi:gluconokinase
MSPDHFIEQSVNEFRDPKLRGVRVLPAVGDGACSNLGAGCATPDRFALMVGTSGAERVVWAPERLQIPRGTWCYRVDERRVVLGGALNDGGSLFDWLRRALRLPALATYLGWVHAHHGLSGAWRRAAAGRSRPGPVVGLRLHTRPIDVLRAALEAIALRFGALDRALVEAMPNAGEVVATGAALLHSPAWMQIMADVLGRPVLASAELQGSSRGVALLALETLGWLDRPLAEHLPDVTERYAVVMHGDSLLAPLAGRRGACTISWFNHDRSSCEFDVLMPAPRVGSAPPRHVAWPATAHSFSWPI